MGSTGLMCIGSPRSQTNAKLNSYFPGVRLIEYHSVEHGTTLAPSTGRLLKSVSPFLTSKTQNN
jgi:hypothetical protein